MQSLRKQDLLLLGLAIVVELAQLYGGRLELLDSPFGGLRAVLILPAAPRRAVDA